MTEKRGKFSLFGVMLSSVRVNRIPLWRSALAYDSFIEPQEHPCVPESRSGLPQ
jgi:hypothetical protein